MYYLEKAKIGRHILLNVNHKSLTVIAFSISKAVHIIIIILELDFANINLM